MALIPAALSPPEVRVDTMSVHSAVAEPILAGVDPAGWAVRSKVVGCCVHYGVRRAVVGWVRRTAVAGSALVLVGVVTGYSSARSVSLLPDLREAPPGCQAGSSPGAQCGDWDICMVGDPQAPSADCLDRGPARAVRLRFTSSVDNIGDGPLVLYGHRDSARSATMAVRQAFQDGGSGPIPNSYGEAQHTITGSMYYEPSKAHVHWHFLDFEHFELRTAAGRTMVTDRKNGFCLGDRYRAHDAAKLRNAVRPQDATPQATLANFLATNNCKHHEPGALDVTEGISVGRGDDYNYDVDYQWLDITTIPSGVYNLVATANPDRHLQETRYDNNSASIAIAVQWPDSKIEPPEVEVVRVCPVTDRCAR